MANTIFTGQNVELIDFIAIDNNFLISVFNFPAHGARTKRQSEETSTKKDEPYEQELCRGKDAGEWFRLVDKDGDTCRDVIQCTSSVSVD